MSEQAKTETLNVSTTPAGLEWLRQAAAAKNLTVSDVVRAAVEAFPGSAAKRQTKAPRSERFRIRVDADTFARLTNDPEDSASDLVAGALRDYQHQIDPKGCWAGPLTHGN